MTAKLLFVDDEPNVLSGIQRSLHGQFEVSVATSGAGGLKLMEESGPFSVVVSDMNMPGMDGVEFLRRAKDIEPDTVRVMLTGNADLRVAMDALQKGSIFQFLVKPCPPESLVLVLSSAVKQYTLVTTERDLLEKTVRGSIRLLMEMLTLADPALFGRVQNLRQDLRRLAKQMDVPDLWQIDLAAMLGHIGLVTLPPSMLAKMRSGSELSSTEAAMLERLPEISHNLLVNIPRLEPVAAVVLYRNKHYDGSGFPDDSMSCETIPIGARLLSVVSDMVKFESEGLSRSGALALMKRRAGWYDPRVIEAAMSCWLPSTSSCVEAKPKQAPSHPIGASDLRIGDVLARNVEASDGACLIAEGQKVTASMVEKIKNFASLNNVKEPIFVVSEDLRTKKAA